MSAILLTMGAAGTKPLIKPAGWETEAVEPIETQAAEDPVEAETPAVAPATTTDADRQMLVGQYQQAVAHLQTQFGQTVALQTQQHDAEFQRRFVAAQTAVDNQARLTGGAVAAALQFSGHAAAVAAPPGPGPSDQLVQELRTEVAQLRAQNTQLLAAVTGGLKMFHHMTPGEFQGQVAELAQTHGVDPMEHPEWTQRARDYIARTHVDTLMGYGLSVMAGRPVPYVAAVLQERMIDSQKRLMESEHALGQATAARRTRPAEAAPPEPWLAHLIVPFGNEGNLEVTAMYRSKDQFAQSKATGFKDAADVLISRLPLNSQVAPDPEKPIILEKDGPVSIGHRGLSLHLEG